jgi:capsule polysaccharide export protein KpsE/RkpR
MSESQKNKVKNNNNIFSFALAVPVILAITLVFLQFIAPDQYKPTSFLSNNFSSSVNDYDACKRI